MKSQTEPLSIEVIAAYTKQWLVEGKLEIAILASNFTFSSPFWHQADREAFIQQFQDPREYQKTTLDKINKFDPVILLFDKSGQHFTIFLTYFTDNGGSVNEVVWGTVRGGLLTKLVSIYDLAETKAALAIC